MPLEKRRQIAERIIALLRAEGYVRTEGQIHKTGECRLSFAGEEDTLWVNLRDKAPSLLEECCNVYEEVHAVGIGLIHTCTRLRPMKYSEIKLEDFSPTLQQDLEKEFHYYYTVFWIVRILVALGVIWKTGGFEMAAHLLGW